MHRYPQYCGAVDSPKSASAGVGFQKDSLRSLHLARRIIPLKVILYRSRLSARAPLSCNVATAIADRVALTYALLLP
jgi:hypothetical protein